MRQALYRALQVVAFLGATWLWHVFDRITGDAVYGWIETKAATRLGLTTPGARDMLALVVQIAPPLALTAAAFWAYHLWWSKTHQVVGAQSLEIIFDPINKGQQFWKRVQAKDRDGNFVPITIWEYRVGVKNNSGKTIRNVRVSTETLGMIPTDPRDLGFQKTGNEASDIAPGYMELVPVWWVWPPRAGDAWGPTATALHGPLRVTARGDDAPPATAEFDYFADQTPALVRKSVS